MMTFIRDVLILVIISLPSAIFCIAKIGRSWPVWLGVATGIVGMVIVRLLS